MTVQLLPILSIHNLVGSTSLAVDTIKSTLIYGTPFASKVIKFPQSANANNDSAHFFDRGLCLQMFAKASEPYRIYRTRASQYDRHKYDLASDLNIACSTQSFFEISGLTLLFLTRSTPLVTQEIEFEDK